MTLLQTITEAFQSLTANKLRSGLTVLGIVIGVAAVIAMLAIGRGAQASITGQINGIGTNLIFILSGNSQNNVQTPKPLTLQDAQALNDPLAAPDVTAVSPLVTLNLNVAYGSQSERVGIFGVDQNYAIISNDSATEGSLITQSDLQGNLPVAVIGPDTASFLFGRSSGVVGNIISIANQPFTVTGVLKSQGGSGFANQDNRVLIPITTALARLSSGNRAPNVVDLIEVQAISSSTVNNAVNEITQILNARHQITNGQSDFTIRTQQQFLSTAQSITGVLTLFLGGIAAISLLVGGIGIMNIMLVSVSERTHEIGLRKAIGARRRDILFQFLTESIVLSVIGGLIGILLAWGISALIGAIAANAGNPIRPQIGLDSILLATLFSMAVGLLFGLYPANRAANLQPVEALRYE